MRLHLTNELCFVRLDTLLLHSWTVWENLRVGKLVSILVHSRLIFILVKTNGRQFVRHASYHADDWVYNHIRTFWFCFIWSNFLNGYIIAITYISIPIWALIFVLVLGSMNSLMKFWRLLCKQDFIILDPRLALTWQLHHVDIKRDSMIKVSELYLAHMKCL